MNDHHVPDQRAWESAMSRDFDARVRDLHEAPLDLGSVKRRAMTIRRHRRIAVAGGVLAVAAVATPVAVLADGGDGDAREPGFAGTTSTDPSTAATTDPTRTATDPTSAPTPTAPVGPAADASYLQAGVWHRDDGTAVDLPSAGYFDAVMWDGRLVAVRISGERTATAEVIAPDGTVVDTFETTGEVAVNDDHSTIAWVDPAGTLRTRWPGGEATLGTGLGETAEPAAVVGGPDCREAPAGDGCVVLVNSGSDAGAQAFSSHGTVDAPAPGAQQVFDATSEGEVTVVDEYRSSATCGGLYDSAAGDYRWRGCDHQAQQIAPGGSHVAGLPSYFDGLGPRTISILDAASGTETGRYASEGDSGVVGGWAWLDDSHLAFSVYDGVGWRVLSMATDGTIGVVAGPVKGSEMEDPFVLIDQ